MTPLRDPHQASAEFLKGLWRENPVFIQVLGMCPALAVTNTAVNGLAMGGGFALALTLLGGVTHRVVDASCRELGFVGAVKNLRSPDGALGLLEQLPGRVLHAATASSRAVRRNGSSPSAHCFSEIRTRLTVTW